MIKCFSLTAITVFKMYLLWQNVLWGSRGLVVRESDLYDMIN